MSQSNTIVVIGMGTIGEAILIGALAARYTPDQIIATTRDTDSGRDRAQYLRATHHVRTSSDAVAAVRDAHLIVLAVKPQEAFEVLHDIAAALGPDAIVLSVAAGLSTSTIESHLPPHARVVRAMPNTPAVIGEGVTAISRGRHATVDDDLVVRRLLQATGTTIDVDEHDMDAIAALSGSGPAYVFHLIEMLTTAGTKLGLDEHLAQDLAIRTIRGASALAERSHDSPTRLREQVTSHGGTTEAALEVLEKHRVPAAYVAALRAARDRSHEMGNL